MKEPSSDDLNSPIAHYTVKHNNGGGCGRGRGRGSTNSPSPTHNAMPLCLLDHLKFSASISPLVLSLVVNNHLQPQLTLSPLSAIIAKGLDMSPVSALLFVQIVREPHYLP